MDFSWTGFAIVLGIALPSFLIFLALFKPGLKYRISQPPQAELDSPEFERILECLAAGKLHRHTKMEVLSNGENYYPAEFEAMRKAEKHIHLEAYIFQRGEVARQALEILTERARAGVKVRLVLDSIGSFTTWESYVRELCDAGGEVAWYHPFRWHTLPRLNNRTHRELMVIDGTVGFIGGAGYADHWLINTPRRRRWRDMMVRVEGELVNSLQATFCENWLEATGELLANEEFFPLCELDEGAPAMVVDSSPSKGDATPARVLFQTLIASAKRSIQITTPYFLPDAGARKELVRALRERGVKVEIVVPGRSSDHLLTRRSSRRLYGDLLEAGARIFEYSPAMIHVKSMVIDDLWGVVGSTNFDNRSFGLNDEASMAVRCERFAARLREDFAKDAAASEPVSLQAWQRRPWYERVHEWFGWVLERQQ